MSHSINILSLYTSLIPKTSYDFRVIAENAIGQSNASEVITVETTEKILSGPTPPDIIMTTAHNNADFSVAEYDIKTLTVEEGKTLFHSLFLNCYPKCLIKTNLLIIIFLLLF